MINPYPGVSSNSIIQFPISSYLLLVVGALAFTAALSIGGNVAHATSANSTVAAPPALPLDGTLAMAGTMSVPRSGHTTTLLGDGRVLVTGGMERNGVFHQTAELFTLASARFSVLPQPMLAARVGHGAVLLANGKVLICGGWGKGGPLVSAELYEPATGQFTATGTMLHARGDFIALRLADGKVLVAGGEANGAVAEAELYDPQRGTFTRTGSMTARRTMHAAALLPDGRVLITGGGEYGRPLAGSEIYDAKTGTFLAAGNMTRERYKHAAVTLPDGNVLIIGGSDGSDWKGQYTSAEIYDVRRNVFVRVGDMRSPRFKLLSAVVLLKSGEVLVAGGAESPEIYVPATRTFRPAGGSLNAPRYFATATLLDDGSVMIAGGYDQRLATSNQAWIYR